MKSHYGGGKPTNGAASKHWHYTTPAMCLSLIAVGFRHKCVGFKVFISHSVEDQWIVYELSKLLKLNGVDAVVAEWIFAPSYPIPDKVARLIDESDCVLVLLTRNGVRSEWVHSEVGYAWGAGKPIILVVEEGVEIKGPLEGRECIPFSRDNPQDAVNRAVHYLKTLAVRKEEEERNKLIFACLLLFFGLAALLTAKR